MLFFEIRRSDPQPQLQPRPSSRLLRMADIRRGRVGQPTSASCSFDPDLQRSLRHGFPPLFATGFVQYRPCFLGIPPRRTLKQWHRLRHELSRHGGQQKARSHYPQPIRSITPYRYLLVLDVKRYFKPLWKPGHLLDNNLKSCGYCLRPTAQIFLRAKANESIHE